MTTYDRGVNGDYRLGPVTLLRHIVLLIVAVALAIYFLADDTPAAWMVRLAWAGAIVAGLGWVLHSLHALSRRP